MRPSGLTCGIACWVGECLGSGAVVAVVVDVVVVVVVDVVAVVVVVVGGVVAWLVS